MKKKFLFKISLFLFFSGQGLADEIQFQFTEGQIGLASEIVSKLESNHLIKKDYIEIKKEVFDLYIDRLDPNKNIFTSEEVDQFFKILKSDSLMKEDLRIAFNLFSKYANRYQQRYEAQIKFLDAIDKDNLNSSRRLNRTLSDGKRLITQEELIRLWIDLSTNDVIQLMLSGNSLEEAVIKTKKRMANQLNYFEQTRDDDVFNIFINSIASIYGPHTNYMSPKNSEDFDINMSLSLEGIGALLSSDGLYTSISSLVPGGPAEKTESLKPKDKIVGIGQDDDEEIVDVVGLSLIHI